MKRKKNYWLIMLVAVVVLGVGYAAVSNVVLNITGTASAKAGLTDDEFIVKFVKALNNTTEAPTFDAGYTASAGFTGTASASVTGDKTATFTIADMQENDEVTFTYFVANLSTENVTAYLYLDVDNSSNSKTGYFEVTPTIVDSSLERNDVTRVTVKVKCIDQLALDSVSGSFGIKLYATTTQDNGAATTGTISTVYSTASTTNEIAAAIENTTNADITLADDVVFAAPIEVDAGQTVEIHLNGNDITGDALEITNGSEVTIDGTGTLTSSNNGSIAYVGADSTLTIKGGTYNATGDTGAVVFADNNANVVINGGQFESVGYVLVSNGSLGDFNATINGGTFTSEYGSVVYMPTQGLLTVNDGTLNGGIFFKQGTVVINGGTINAWVAPNATYYDDYADWYNYGNGEPWYGDAIVLNGGQYALNSGSSSSTSNDAVLIINGGTIKSENNRGTALAVLNTGKVAQSMKVTINGGTFSTNAARDTFEVINMEGFGNTSYGTAEQSKQFVNYVDVTITGTPTGLSGVTSNGKWFKTGTLWTNTTTY